MEIWERPIRVKGERVWRTWLGGRELDRLHGVSPPRDSSIPEEWMLSTTRARNVGREDIEEGICRLAEGDGKVTLKQIVEEHPREMLGAGIVEKFGCQPGILVKLIDAGARLQLQVHPDKPTAKRLFNSDFGKTECWHILSLRSDCEKQPCLYIGFRPGVDKAAWRDCFFRGDSEGMLAMLHRIVPEPGQTFMVRGGVPHAIGGGCFLVEIQEPTDLTLRLERKMPHGPDLSDAACHQGLGFDRMFECFDYEAKTEAEALAACRLASRVVEETGSYRVESLVDQGRTDCFRMERLSIAGSMPFPNLGEWTGLYVHKGLGRLQDSEGVKELAPNDQLFVPASCRAFTVENAGQDPLRLLRFAGPKIG